MQRGRVVGEVEAPDPNTDTDPGAVVLLVGAGVTLPHPGPGHSHGDTSPGARVELGQRGGVGARPELVLQVQVHGAVHAQLTAAAVRVTRVVGAPVVHSLVHHLLQAVHVQAVQRGGAQRVRLGAERVRRVVVARAVPVAVAVVVVVNALSGEGQDHAGLGQRQVPVEAGAAPPPHQVQQDLVSVQRLRHLPQLLHRHAGHGRRHLRALLRGGGRVVPLSALRRLQSFAVSGLSASGPVRVRVHAATNSAVPGIRRGRPVSGVGRGGGGTVDKEGGSGGVEGRGGRGRAPRGGVLADVTGGVWGEGKGEGGGSGSRGATSVSCGERTADVR